MKKLSEMKIHIIGIGGTGMAPIAIVLHEMGADVSGSDRSESVYTQDLRSRGIQVMVPQCAENLRDPDMVFYSSAIHDDNPEPFPGFLPSPLCKLPDKAHRGDSLPGT